MGYIVTRDGRTLATVPTESEAWGYILRIQGQSVQYATKNEGYDIIYPNGEKLSDTYKRTRGRTDGNLHFSGTPIL